MKRAALVLGSYFSGGLLLYVLSTFMPESSTSRDWLDFLGLIGMSFPATILAGLSMSLPHEMGHIWASKRRGFQVYGLSLMGFSWTSYLGRNYWKWEFEQLFQGHRSMAKKNPSLNDLRLVLISGPITSLIVAAIWSPFLFFEPTLVFGIIAVGANLLYALGSILPTKHYQNGENHNDGTYLLMSYREPQKLQRLIRIHYDRIAEWLRPSGYNLSPVSLSGKPHEDCASNLF